MITVVSFLILLMALVALLLFTKQKLSPSGPVTIKINGEKEVVVASGSSLLTTLGNNKIFLPSACGGGGTCIQCECHVLSGGGEALPTETPHFSKRELNHGARLACQIFEGNCSLQYHVSKKKRSHVIDIYAGAAVWDN